MASNIKLSGVMAEHARNKAAPGLIIPRVKDHMLKTFGPDLERDTSVIHPSELAKADWCPLATYYHITLGVWPEEKFDYVRENIFDTGYDIQDKWLARMRAAGFPLWGDWRCIVCNWRVTGLEPPDETSEGHDHIWKYAEVHMDAVSQMMMFGHSDAAFDNSLVEFKSVGVGTIRIDAPDLLMRHTEGKHINLTGLWRDVTRPLKSHLIQGDIYLHLAHILGLPFTQIVFLYEFKANQLTKEFTIQYSPSRVKPLVAKAAAVKYAVEQGIPPKCIKMVGCKQCNAYPQPRRRTVAGTRADFS